MTRERGFAGTGRGAVLVAVLAAALALGGCGSREVPPTKPPPVPPTPQSQLTGVFVGAAENGLLDVTVETIALAARRFPAGPAGILRAPAAVETTVTALGTMSKDSGGVVNLTGTYDTNTDSLRLSGQGYALWGLYIPGGAPPRLEGRYAGPSGTGRFAVMFGPRTVVRTFCATYENAPTATLFGTLDLAVAGSALTGFQSEDGDTLVEALQGTASGTGVTRAIAFAGPDFYGNGSWDTVTGHVAGVWASSRGNGVWSGDPCVPGTTGPSARRPPPR